MIYHVVHSDEWNRQINLSNFVPPDYHREGFIHCCTKEQLSGVLNRYYKGVSGLLVLHLDESKLSSELKYELSTNNEKFPHLFGAINRDAVVKTEALPTIH